MREELAIKLAVRFQEFAEINNSSIGDGWFGIVYEMFEKVEEVLYKSTSEEARKVSSVIDRLDGNGKTFTIDQMKEKFGELRIYYGISTATTSEWQREVVDKIVSNAEDKSLSICEECGNKGKIRKDRHWLKTLCDVCSSK